MTEQKSPEEWTKGKSWEALAEHGNGIWPKELEISFNKWTDVPQNLHDFSVWEEEWNAKTDEQKARFLEISQSGKVRDGSALEKVLPEVKRIFNEELNRWKETEGLEITIPKDTYDAMNLYLEVENLAGYKITRDQLVDAAIEEYIHRHRQPKAAENEEEK